MKKLLLGLGTITAVAVPVVAIVSCGEIDFKDYKIGTTKESPQGFSVELINTKLNKKYYFKDIRFINRKFYIESDETPAMDEVMKKVMIYGITNGMKFKMNGNYLDITNTITGYFSHNYMNGNRFVNTPRTLDKWAWEGHLNKVSKGI